jgi:hypothetical protein
MKKLKEKKLTLKEIETLKEAKIILDRISNTKNYYVEFWKEFKMIRINTDESSKRNSTISFSPIELKAQGYGLAKECWTRDEVRQNKKDEDQI